MTQNNNKLLKQFINTSKILNSEEYWNLFSSQDNVEDIMQYISPKREEWETQKEEKRECLYKFARKMKDAGVQICFLQAVIKYINNRLIVGAFYDYEHAIRYSCIAAAGLKDLEGLEKQEKEDFFDNLLTGIKYAGENGEKGYAYEGKEEIRRYAFLLTGELVKEIAERNFVINVDSIIKKIPNDNMVYFVSNSSVTKKEKEIYKRIDELLVKKCYASLVLLIDCLEQVFEGYILSNFIENAREDYKQISELREELTGNRVSAWGRLDVWNCSVRYRVTYEYYRDFELQEPKELKLEYRIDPENNKEIWMDNSKYNGVDYLGEIWQNLDGNKKIQNVMNNYLANWAERDISGSMTKNELEVQCFWHDEFPERGLEENIIKIKGCPCITHEKVKDMHIFTINPPKEETVQNCYWINNADSEAIKSINIILGKNGSGKTSTMMLMRYDGLEANAKEVLTKFFIVYKRGKNYYYSTNLREKEYDLKGDVLKKGKGNISKYRGQKNKVIYYSNVLQPYEERMELMASNTLDLSSQYIRDMEIGGLPRNKMIHTKEICDQEKEFRLKYKKDYNQDVLRQLYFLYDVSDRSESWMPDYINRFENEYANEFVLMRCSLDEEDTGDKINKYMADNGLGKELTGFWKYKEWKVYYKNKYELKKIIEICEKIIKDKKILYFEVCLRQMSSGERARLTLFSRLHAWVSKMTFSDYRQNNVLLLDELEAYMHPEWQRCLIHDLICFLEWEHSMGHPVKVQLFISSNSPFLISDVYKEEITVLSKDITMEKETFAQNIHVILKDSFLKKNGSMGEYAKQKVDRVYGILADCLTKKNNTKFKPDLQVKRECNIFIKKIGEQLIKKDLQEMYEEAFSKEEKNIDAGKLLSEMSDEELSQYLKAVQEEQESRRK